MSLRSPFAGLLLFVQLLPHNFSAFLVAAHLEMLTLLTSVPQRTTLLHAKVDAVEEFRSRATNNRRKQLPIITIIKKKKVKIKMTG